MSKAKNGLDEVDLKILRALQSQPEINRSKIAKNIGISLSACVRRVRRLETSGVICGRAVVLNPDRFNLGLNVMVSITLKENDKSTMLSVESLLQDLPEIVDCFRTTGGADYACRVLVADVPAYEKFLSEVLLPISSIKAVQSNIALKRIKQTSQIAI